MVKTQLLGKSKHNTRSSLCESSVSVLIKWNILRVLEYPNKSLIASPAVEYCQVATFDTATDVFSFGSTPVHSKSLIIGLYLLIPYLDFEDFRDLSCLMLSILTPRRIL